MKRCLVLLCTYNGEKYLREQLDSILSQKDIEVAVKAADDRSTDGTKEILKEYAEKFPAFTYSVNEKNKGFCYNFLDLIFSVKDTDYDYYALSDQDDVWLPEKLKRAAEQIESKGETQKGTLYCSNLLVTDEKLTPLHRMEEKFPKVNRYSASFFNIATGCTIVFDKKFLLQSTKHYPSDLQLHDDWLFLLAMYTADFIYDFEGHDIYYRQHAENLIGSGDKKTKEKKGKVYWGWPCVKEIIALYGDEISKKNLKILIRTRDYRKKFSCRLKIIFSTKYYRSRFGIRFRIGILLGRQK